ncbi:COMM domain-containing protein 9 isoform X2 [Ailuropoda melanoleuca]|uniref:COMM domain-containing protein 9 isoform X2 n=1 Tax=Ailuropoda melanoleuca TaxID=9646 RepID=UPI001493E9C8|nr:COMM domain-containing protein 9 isoform X2 [Ailuropoda melanoleuca]
MAALTGENFAALQSLLKASSKDVVRQLCQESFSSSALGSEKLLDITRSSLSVTQEEAEQACPAAAPGPAPPHQAGGVPRPVLCRGDPGSLSRDFPPKPQKPADENHPRTRRLALWLRSVTQPSGLPVPESGLGEVSGVGSELARCLHSLSAAPGRPGLESGHQDLLRQHQPHGRPHLPAADEDPGRS